MAVLGLSLRSTCVSRRRRRSFRFRPMAYGVLKLIAGSHTGECRESTQRGPVRAFHRNADPVRKTAFVCDFADDQSTACGMAFTTQSNLRRHIRKHDSDMEKNEEEGVG